MDHTEVNRIEEGDYYPFEDEFDDINEDNYTRICPNNLKQTYNFLKNSSLDKVSSYIESNGFDLFFTLTSQVNDYIYCECIDARKNNNNNNVTEQHRNHPYHHPIHHESIIDGYCDDINLIHDFKDLLLNYIKNLDVNKELNQVEINILKVLKNADYVEKYFPAATCEKCGLRLLLEDIPNGNDAFLTNKRAKLEEFNCDSRLCAITVCAQMGRVAEAHYLLETYHVNPNGCNFCTYSPLALAIKHFNHEMATLLLDHNADTSRNISFFTYSNNHLTVQYPLHYCIRLDLYAHENDLAKSEQTDEKLLKMFILLLKYGANPADLLHITSDSYVSFILRSISQDDIKRSLFLNSFHRYVKVLHKFIIDLNLLKLIYTIYVSPFYTNENNYVSLDYDENYLNNAKENARNFNFLEVNESIRYLFFQMPTLKERCRFQIRSIVKLNKRNNSLIKQLNKLAFSIPNSLVDYLKYDY